jgi:sugar phosphate isomerase/epimerase
LARSLRGVGVDSVQLHLDPLRRGDWSVSETTDALARAQIEVRSGMMSMEGEDYSSLEAIERTGGVRPTATWQLNRVAARANASLARRLGLNLVTFHAGFLPHDRQDSEREVLLGRLRELVDVFGNEGVRIGFETGQERAETLLEVLADLDRPTAGINFDPANMILYGMGDPVEALRRLSARVVQVHIKDAKPSSAPGTWGEEVCVGTGQVNWDGFFQVLREEKLEVDCMIEREAGERRIDDMRTARELLERYA